jgi:hypothetical protein
MKAFSFVVLLLTALLISLGDRHVDSCGGSYWQPPNHETDEKRSK